MQRTILLRCNSIFREHIFENPEASITLGPSIELVHRVGIVYIYLLFNSREVDSNGHCIKRLGSWAANAKRTSVVRYDSDVRNPRSHGHYELRCHRKPTVTTRLFYRLNVTNISIIFFK